nr:hypothetical protein [Edwardsiella ictaluri]
MRLDADRAASSAAEASVSAGHSGESASSAHNAQVAATQSASQASGSASEAASSAGAARASEIAAAGGASSAAQSASQASGSASVAASGASAAKASEATAAGSASAAAGSAQSAKMEADRIAGALDTKQDKSHLLSAIAALQAAANKVLVLTGPNTVEAAGLSDFVKLLLSKNDAAAVLEYLGLSRTVDLAANAWSKNIIGTLVNGGTFANCDQSGIYNVGIADTNTVSDFPNVNGHVIYSYGMMVVLQHGDVIEQLYMSHHGHVASRQTWSGRDEYLPWVVQYSNVNEPAYFKYGCPLVGSCISWCNAHMPQEIWPDCGMEFIPWMGQAFDPAKYPLAHNLWPDNRLPVDMRGYGVRAWDNGRGIDSGRWLLSYQEDALQNFTGTMFFNEMVGGVPSSGVFSERQESRRNTYRNEGAGYASTITFNPATVARTAAETRGKTVAWNMIVRMK